MRRGLLLLATMLGLAAAQAAPAPAPEADPQILLLQSASLATREGVREVALPHVLRKEDFAPEGERVHYRLEVRLPGPPERPLGVFVNKLSLSGSLRLNGEFVDACAQGDMERTRCLHRPHLFKPAPRLWRPGANILEFEIYATARQSNGLSAVLVGDADRLHQEHLAPRLWWTVTVKQGLVFVSLALGTFCLAIGLRLGHGSPFAWWGWTNLLFALSGINGVADQLPLPVDIVNWAILTSRFDTAVLFLLAFLSAFGKLRPWMSGAGLSFALAVTIATYALESNRAFMVAAYVPILLVGPLVLAAAVRWTLQEPSARRAAMSTVMVTLFALGVHDWLKFGDPGAFEYDYLVPYGFSAAVVFIGFLLNAELVNSLRQSRELSADLEQRVAARTSALNSALLTIQNLEQTALQLTESIPVGTFVLRAGPEGRAHLTFVSRRCLEMLGLRRGDLMANPRLALRALHPEDRAALEDLPALPRDGSAPFLWEGRILSAGDARWLSVEAIPRPLPDGSLAFEGVVVDITTHKEAVAQLKATYEKLTEAAIQHSKVEERNQLLQEMHDGFGSQLATARLMAEKGKLRPEELPVVLQECMADLYLVADTLSGTAHTLEDALADFRFRTERRMHSVPVRIEWNIVVDEALVLPERTTLQVLRIAQEAVNNALRHSKGGRIGIEVAHDGPQGLLRVSVEDGGVGLPPSFRRGRGMHNMHQRARSIGATLSIVGGPSGTRVLLVVPTSGTPAPGAATPSPA